MAFDPSIFFAALGITTLEIVEAGAVGLALYGDSKKPSAFGYVSLGIIFVFVPLFLIGSLFSKLPFYDVKLVGGILMVYFGQRLVKSARKAVLKQRKGSVFSEQSHKDIAATGFSVGAIEAFEASIVLVALLPVNYSSTVYGMAVAIVVVIVAIYALKNQVRKIKQASMKVVVAALLLAFAALWFTEVGLHYSGLIVNPVTHTKLLHPNLNFYNVITAPTNEQNLLIIPYFLLFLLVVYRFANRPSPPAEPVPTPAPAQPKQ